MATAKEDLWKILENLTGDQFKKFKWFLEDNWNGLQGIPVSRLEKADRPDTVDLMVQQYGKAEAVRRSMQVLEKISRNDLAQRLSNTRSAQRGEFENDLTAVPSQCESERQKSRLREMKSETRLKIKEREMKICEIQRSAELSRKSAERQTAESRQTFRVLIQSVEESLSLLTEAVEEKQKTFQKQAEQLIRDLEEEISALTKSEAELDRLLLTDTNLPFPLDVKTSDLTEFSILQPSYGKTVMASMDKLKEMLDGEMKKFVSKAKLIRMQQFAVNVTLDPDTAHPNLVVSPDGKQVHCGDVKQNLPENPERFDTAANVLGRQSFSSGRVYFEAEVRGKTSWDVGVVYGSIGRKGSISSSPSSGYWAVGLRSGDTIKAAGLNLDVKTPLNKVGVFVDYGEGSIIFYNVDSAEQIHQYSDCSFTEKLYPFFSPGVYHGGSNTKPLVISQNLNPRHLRFVTEGIGEKEAELEKLREFAVDVTWDPDTAHRDLVLSSDGKQVYDTNVTKDLQMTSQRFDTCASVVGKETFSSGKFYIEVQVEGKTDWSVRVAHESINRKGKICLSPDNGFWTIWLKDKVYEALAEPSVVLPLKSRLQKVGICGL